MTEHRKVVIIGGGIVGCSIAYHLGKMGWKDVLVIEKGELTSGSTWHAAGLVGQLRSSRNITRLLKYSVELYSKLEEETGQATGWKQVGGLRVASSQDRWIELKKAATTAKSFGLEMQLLTPQEAVDLFPVMSIDGIVGAAFLPTDGHIDPSSVTMAMAKGARMQGIEFRRNTLVTGLKVEKRRVTEIQTDKGNIRADIVVNAAGMWARALGKMAGVSVPLIPVEHQYLVTEKIKDLPKDLPTMRDPDHLVYYKEEVGALVMGGYEPNPIPWSLKGIPKDFDQQLLPENFDHFEQLSLLALKRTPILEKAGVRKLINGPEAFTPDGYFVMGLAPELDNFFVAAGFNAHGIAAGGGVGMAMAEWIVEGRASLDLWPVDIRRFGKQHDNLRYIRDRTLEAYAKHYTMGWPHEENSAGRQLRRSPLYQVLKERGAVYGQKFGWERTNWFAPEGVEPVDEMTFGRPNWSKYVGEECRAAREDVVIMDQTPFSKFEVTGPGALMFLQGIAANNVRKPPGRLTYTQLCNDRGGIECDLTIARVGPEHFYIVTGTAFGVHDMQWIRSHMPDDGSVQLRDVTATRAVLNLSGPKARKVLEQVTDIDVSHEGFPFAHCREINIGFAPALALRVTYVGELGWELHIPCDYALTAYETLWKAGQAFNIRHAGYRAIESLRLEKGYRYWSSDLTPDYNPFEAGLGFCVSLKKKVPFIGKEALRKAKENGVEQQLCCFVLSKDVELLGGETIICDGKVLGVLTSGGYGHTVQKTIAYGYVPKAYVDREDFQIEVLGEAIDAKQHKGALYDPERKKIMC